MFIGGCIPSISLVCDALEAVADITCQINACVASEKPRQNKTGRLAAAWSNGASRRLELGLNKSHWMTKLILILVKILTGWRQLSALPQAGGYQVAGLVSHDIMYLGAAHLERLAASWTMGQCPRFSRVHFSPTAIDRNCGLRQPATATAGAYDNSRYPNCS